MALRNSQPLKWTPMGVSDTLDATNTPTGMMNALTNLIPDRTTRGVWVCRPAAILKTSFQGYANAKFISTYIVLGTRVYGLVGTTRNGGHDEPFSYNLATGVFDVVSNVTNANTPVSPVAVGAWTPPTMALVGTKIVVTHAGFAAVGKKIGWFDISNPLAPSWDAGDVATNPLAAVPTAVFNFFGRAYYAVNTTVAALEFSDILDPLTKTNANQVLTLEDNIPCTALGGLPLSSTQGAIFTTLVAFKGASSMYFITGDAALNNLRKDKQSASTGTLAPNSICSTSKGLGFVAPDGLRFVEFSGQISDPIGSDGSGICVPFIYAVEPSRIVAAANGDTVKISVQNGNALGTPNQEYWFDTARQCWSGPHTFAASLIEAYGNTFIKTAIGVDGKLFQSDAQQSLGSLYVENGATMNFAFITPLLPDTDTMCECSMVEATVDLAFTPGTPAYAVVVGDENGTYIDTLSVAAGGAATPWGGFTWGSALWLGQNSALAPRNLAWHEPVVFRRMFLGINGQCSANAKFGTWRTRYELLGYLQENLGGST